MRTASGEFRTVATLTPSRRARSCQATWSGESSPSSVFVSSQPNAGRHKSGCPFSPLFEPFALRRRLIPVRMTQKPSRLRSVRMQRERSVSLMRPPQTARAAPDACAGIRLAEHATGPAEARMLCSCTGGSRPRWCTRRTLRTSAACRRERPGTADMRARTPPRFPRVSRSHRGSA